jgi:phospholipid-transporting ATPase
VLLRGAQLRNTEWVHGLVIYTGRDSKLIQNMTKTPLKRSSMDKATNRQVIFMFLVLVVLSVVSAICYAVWNAVWAERLWYLQMSSDEGGRGLVSFFYSILTFLILYNNLIPISLIITVEVS